jgi:uncharacterized membrane protein
MNRLLRILKHRWLDETDAQRALDATALSRLRKRVQEGESRHRGEIRVCVEAGLPLSYLWRNATPRERAITLFGKLRVWDTEHNSGVLIYLLLAERAIEIVADRGLARHVSPHQWRGLTHGMSAEFKTGHFERGLMQAIETVDRLLNQHFPLQPGELNPNELPDQPDLR